MIFYGDHDRRMDDSITMRGEAGRKSTREIFADLSENDRERRFILMVDHQPVGVEENSAEGVELQLSGHLLCYRILRYGGMGLHDPYRKTL